MDGSGIANGTVASKKPGTIGFILRIGDDVAFDDSEMGRPDFWFGG